MPAKTGKQYRFFQAVLHGKGKTAGPSKEVAKKFIDETSKGKRRAFMKEKK